MTKNRLSIGSIFGYGIAEWGCNAIETFFRINLIFYCTDILGMDPSTAGIIVGLGVVWDAITDPIVGTLSDRWQSSSGYRLPFMLAGMIGLPLSTWALFAIAPESQFLMAKFTLLYLLCNTSLTLIAVPHAAIAGDLSHDDKVRRQIFAVRYFYTIIGLLTGIAVPGYIFQTYGTEYSSYLSSATYLAMVIFVSSLITIWQANRFKLKTSKSLLPHSFFGDMDRAFKNKGFIILLLAYLAATIGQTINSSVALYYYRFKLEFTETNVQSILVVFSLVITFSLPLWYFISNRFNKVTLISTAIILLGAIGAIVYPLFPKKALTPVYIMSVVGGFLVGSVFLLDVILTDLVDKKSEQGSMGSYGTYFGIWKLVSKLARALAIGMTGLLLELIGFIPKASNQSEDTLQGLAYIFGPGVGLFFVLGGIIVLYLHRSDYVK